MADDVDVRNNLYCYDYFGGDVMIEWLVLGVCLFLFNIYFLVVNILADDILLILVWMVSTVVSGYFLIAVIEHIAKNK